MKKLLLPLSLIGTIAMMVIMSKTGASLKTKDTPLGILHLELAFNKPVADKTVSTWQQTANSEGINNISVAKSNTWWDFLFILCYSYFLYALTLKLSGYFTGGFSRYGEKLAKAAFIAAGMDVLENTGMFLMLNGNTGTTLVLLTSIFSALKWLVVIAIGLYILITVPLALYSKVR